jgi:CRISPR/Cas system endoribonuclease Cas6 (RAMP superfamily)
MKEETPMKTNCTAKQLEFQGLCGKKIILSNDGDLTTTDGGLILSSSQFGIIRKLATCFHDLRRQKPSSTGFLIYSFKELQVLSKAMRISTIT